ncbi:MAG: glutamate synthase subunit alpha, partial [Gammaproteobacteria bacterium]|nr:glutamate synthase subunit alpha [Gammaproteobacteria bacterium]
MDQDTLPVKQGLYDPANEHDSCGVGFVADIKGRKSHRLVEQGLDILDRLTHRGAVGADPMAGDGAGILLQIPDQFFRAESGFDLPKEGNYAIGMLFLPQNEFSHDECTELLEKLIEAEGQQIIGWREVPVNNSGLGVSVIPTEPVVKQIFVSRGSNCADQDAFERKLFVIRKQIEKIIREAKLKGGHSFYFSSFSSRTIVYKGMLLSNQVGDYFPDLMDVRVVTALALVHQRFSTNTFPTWDLAQP